MSGVDDERVPIRAITGFVTPPPDMTTEAERHRWEVAVEAATRMSECFEPSGVADPMIVRAAARQLYYSDIPTD